MKQVPWSLADVLIWLGLVLPCWLLLSLAGRLLPASIPLPFRALIVQFLLYALLFGLLKILLMVKYDIEFWSGLGWVTPDSGLWLCLVCGPVVAVALNFAAQALKAPAVEPPFPDLFFTLGGRILFGVAGVIAGPLCEELAFRGFLQPALVKAVGVIPGILVTGVAFGALHGQQTQWMWQYVVLLSLAGSVFGWARWRYSSTMSSMVMHAGYNLIIFVGRLYG